MKTEKRQNARRKLTGLMPGKLINSKGVVLNCRPIDVSPGGIGFITADQIADNSVITLQYKDIMIQLKVAWRKPDFGKQELFRYGVVVVEPKVDLIDIFTEARCLR